MIAGRGGAHAEFPAASAAAGSGWPGSGAVRPVAVVVLEVDGEYMGQLAGTAAMTLTAPQSALADEQLDLSLPALPVLVIDVKRVKLSGPVTAVAAGLTVSWVFLAVAVPRRCVGGVLLERPQPRSSEDERAGCRRAAADHGARRVLSRWLRGGRSVSPVRGGRSGLVSTHSAGPAACWRAP
jgi:hypothetical protein